MTDRFTLDGEDLTTHRVHWFPQPDRPVEGNTIHARPAGPDMSQSAALTTDGGIAPTTPREPEPF